MSDPFGKRRSQPQAVSTRQRVSKVVVSGEAYCFLPASFVSKVAVSKVAYGFLPARSSLGLTRSEKEGLTLWAWRSDPSGLGGLTLQGLEV
jgi:hypothetical protein